ncbi:MAG TPA: hypothetical protein VGD17_08910 [Chitinophagaceae bacterium]
MKRILIALVFVAGFIIIGKTAAAQQLKYFYYPATNVYYDPGSDRYIYYRNGSWTQVPVLPPSMAVAGVPRVAVYSPTPEVWRMNAEHKVKYKNYPKGKAVGYKGTNPNKAQGKIEHKAQGKNENKPVTKPKAKAKGKQ